MYVCVFILAFRYLIAMGFVVFVESCLFFKTDSPCVVQGGLEFIMYRNQDLN